jgi:hypothetical protein
MSKSHDYLTWTDSRLRGWLRQHGIPVTLSTRREELIQRVRENYVSTQGSLDHYLHAVQEWIYGGVGVAEEKVFEPYPPVIKEDDLLICAHQVREALAMLKGAVAGQG